MPPANDGCESAFYHPPRSRRHRSPLSRAGSRWFLRRCPSPTNHPHKLKHCPRRRKSPRLSRNLRCPSPRHRSLSRRSHQLPRPSPRHLSRSRSRSSLHRRQSKPPLRFLRPRRFRHHENWPSGPRQSPSIHGRRNHSPALQQRRPNHHQPRPPSRKPHTRPHRVQRPSYRPKSAEITLPCSAHGSKATSATPMPPASGVRRVVRFCLSP